MKDICQIALVNCLSACRRVYEVLTKSHFYTVLDILNSLDITITVKIVIL